jgi:cytochrome c
MASLGPLAAMAAAGVAALALALPAGAQSGGAALYEARCAGCHSIDQHRIGPRHRGLVGRRAGTEPGFDYSPALRASGVTWTPQQLDRWLQNPGALVPGTRMGFRLASAQERQAIIAYLQTQRRR